MTKHANWREYPTFNDVASFACETSREAVHIRGFPWSSKVGSRWLKGIAHSQGRDFFFFFEKAKKKLGSAGSK